MSNTAISTALSGLSSASTAISVIGNNLANVNTTGYKDVHVSFEDLVSEFSFGDSKRQIGLGVSAPLTSSSFSQGSINTVSGSFNAAINGGGFFLVKDANNQTLLTRDGTFRSDSAGNLTTLTGNSVQGWQADAKGAINAGGPVTSLKIPVGGTYPPSATNQFSLDANLNSAAATGTTFTQQIDAVDSLGNAVPLTVTFTQASTASTPGTWNYQITMPASLGTGTTTTPVDLLSTPGTITFDSNGKLSTPASTGSPIAITVPTLADGATIGAANVLNWNLYNTDGSAKLTQFSAVSAASAKSQDGEPASQLTGVSIGSDGNIEATYSNGIQQLVGQLALGSVQNPESLQSKSNNNFALTGNTSALTVGPAGSGGRGEIQGQALEASTVDVASEFANLLIFQRSYQANSRVITASDEMAQDTMQLIK